MVADTVISGKNSDVRADVNSSVTLTCVTTARDNVRWTLYREISPAPVTLFNGFKVNPKFPRIRVKIDEDTGHSEMMIRNVHSKDSGNYSCKVIGSNTDHVVSYFTLTVIGQ